MKHILVSILSLTMVTAMAQKKVILDELKNYVGDSVEVRGKVAAIVQVRKSSNSTIIHVGEKPPKESLSILVPAAVSKDLGFGQNNNKYISGMVVVKGRVENQNGKIRMAIFHSKQLMFIYDEEVPLSETQLPE